MTIEHLTYDTSFVIALIRPNFDFEFVYLLILHSLEGKNKHIIHFNESVSGRFYFQMF